MPFIFKPDMAAPRQQEKLEEAARRRDEVFRKHPDLEELDHKIKERELKLRGARFHGLNQGQRSRLQEEIKGLKEQFQVLLQERGIPQDFKEPRWDCPRCEDRGEILTSTGFVRCGCHQEQDLDNLRRQAGLPPRYANATFASASLDLYAPRSDSGQDTPRVRAERAFRAGREFVQKQLTEKSSRGLLIDGPVGSGKTFLLACVANELLAHGRAVRYISYSDFLFLVRLSFAPDSPYSEYELIRDIERIPVLIIDDLGTEQATDFSSSLLYRIIDHRYGKKLPFVISTSCSLNQLARRLGYLGEKIMQRVTESCRISGLRGDIREKIMARERGNNG